MFNCACGATSLYGPVFTMSLYMLAVRPIDGKKGMSPTA